MAKRLDRTGRLTNWDDARRAETSYQSKLLGIARQVGVIVDGLAPDGIVRDLSQLLDTLNRYAALIEPWARATAGFMIADVSRRNERLWRQNGARIAASLREEIAGTSQGQVFRELMAENVDLITSLPRKAGERVHKLTQEGLLTGRRAESIAKEIQESGHVTKSRARLIARTEVSRTASKLVEARAIRLGSEGYIWRTSKDSDVRDTHKAMEGKYVRWSTPPKTDPGLDPYHAGCGPNCRCYPEPVFPDFE